MRWRQSTTVFVLLAASVLLAMLDAKAVAAACVRGVAPWDTLRVRTGPGAGFAEVGGIPPGACGVALRGACRGAWCPVSYGAIAGWSNARYLDGGARGTSGGSVRRSASATGSVCVRGLPSGETLKVRAAPSASGELLYGFHNGSCGVRITGACEGGYCPVLYRGFRGWADSRYLR